MVTPIYDYDGALASRSPSPSSSTRTPRYAYAYSASGQLHGSSPSHYTHSSPSRPRDSYYSRYSPSYVDLPSDTFPYGAVDADQLDEYGYPVAYSSPSRSPSRKRRYERSPVSASTSSMASEHPRGVYTDSEYSSDSPRDSRPRASRRTSSYSPSYRGSRARRYDSPSPERYYDRDSYPSSRYRYSDYPREDSEYRRSRSRPIHTYRERPPNDPIAQNPPDYQIQATHGSQHITSHVPSHVPSHHSHHTTASHHRPDPLSVDYAYQASHPSQSKPGSIYSVHQSHGKPPPTSASLYAGRSPFYPPSVHTVHSGHASSHRPAESLYVPSVAPSGGRPSSYLSASTNSVGNELLGGGFFRSGNVKGLISSVLGFSADRGCLTSQKALDKYGVDEVVREYLRQLPCSRDFCLSRCTGKKKAVCIGINYIGQRNELRGCANDARNMRDYLIRHHNFPPDQILLLVDDDSGPQPTRREMFNAMRWLVSGAEKDCSLFFHYSGHGGQSKDASGREIDGYDEVIYPLDFDQEGDIIDDELHQALVSHLPAGARLTAVFDACHSGTVLDLPYLHSAHGRLRSISHVSRRARKRGVADSGDVICFSACKDDETSADTFKGGVATGAMSHALIATLEEKPHQTFEELLAHLRHILVPKYHQKAQISGTHPVDLSREFTL